MIAVYKLGIPKSQVFVSGPLEHASASLESFGEAFLMGCCAGTAGRAAAQRVWSVARGDQNLVKAAAAQARDASLG